jgi:hypothetical protein
MGGQSLSIVCRLHFVVDSGIGEETASPDARIQMAVLNISSSLRWFDGWVLWKSFVALLAIWHCLAN